MKMLSPVAMIGLVLGVPLSAQREASELAVGRRAPSAQHNLRGHALQQSSPYGFSSTAMGANRFELTFRGRRFVSRDQVEGYLLYRAALVTRASGGRWFVLLHLPGERGAQDHPARQSPAFGQAYVHWQPHWSYQLTGQGWQPWHPEWGAQFWADARAPRDVEQFEAHAIIELRRGAFRADDPMAFDAARVVRDLAPGFGSPDAAAR